MHKKLFNERGYAVPLLVILAAAGILVFLGLANFGPFKDSQNRAFYPKKSTHAAGTFNLIGTHPYAAAQPSTTGKIIGSLVPFKGKLYLGFGDTYTNTGPIHIAPFDPATNNFTTSLLASDTEAIRTFRDINGQLYATHDDPKNNGNNAYSIGEPWREANTVGVDAIHVTDVTTLTGSDLYVSGSQYSNNNAAAIWKSTDGGANWTTILSQNTSICCPRFYFIGSYNGKLYVQLTHYRGLAGNKSQVYNGTSWSDGPNLFAAASSTAVMGSPPQNFAGKMVYKTLQPTYDIANNTGGAIITTAQTELLYFDGTQSTKVPFTVYDFTINGNYLYALGTDKQIRKTTDLINWEIIATAPTTSYSIGTLNDKLYIGTTDSKLYVYSEMLDGTTPSPTFTPIPTPTFSPSPTLTPSPAPTATPTQSPTPSPTPALKTGDINGDGTVGILDFAMLLSKWNTTDSSADLNNDGTVGIQDFAILLSKWGT